MINLLPKPQILNLFNGECKIKDLTEIYISSENPSEVLSSAKKIQSCLNGITNSHHPILAGNFLANENPTILLKVNSDLIGHDQGYRLTISSDNVTIIGNDSAGLFYGVCTFLQLIRNSEADKTYLIHNTTIQDWPNFKARGVMLDISRDKVPTQETLFRLVDMLASLKINQLQLYTEHTFAYRQHPVVWAEASPMTSEEIIELDLYCRERFIELVPNQNSFGHMHRWLDHPEYAKLGELYQVNVNNWWGHGSFSLSPLEPGSIKLISSLYDELLPNFSSTMVNVGCDETFDIGLGNSKAACEKHGKGQVYTDFLLKIYDLVSSRNHTMQFWGDIILEHPNLIPYLPKDVIALEWGYEANHPFEQHTAEFASAGIPFYICPGTSAWNSIAGRTDNMIINIANAAKYGLSNGAIGLLNTDWGDNGHWQALPISYIGYAVGAAYAWSSSPLTDEEIQLGVSQHLFKDFSGNTGKILFDLGNVYKATETQLSNASVVFKILQTPLRELEKNNFPINEIIRLEEAIFNATKEFSACDIQLDDKELITSEILYTINLMNHGINRLKYLYDPETMPIANLKIEIVQLINSYRDLWHKRNRTGGFKDSLSRFEKILHEYEQ